MHGHSNIKFIYFCFYIYIKYLTLGNLLTFTMSLFNALDILSSEQDNPQQMYQ
jgi:hypothetical protein